MGLGNHAFLRTDDGLIKEYAFCTFHNVPVVVAYYDNLATFDWDDKYINIYEVERVLGKASGLNIYLYRSLNGFRGFCTSHKFPYEPNKQIVKALKCDPNYNLVSEVYGTHSWTTRISGKTYDDFPVYKFIRKVGDQEDDPDMLRLMHHILAQSDIIALQWRELCISLGN